MFKLTLTQKLEVLTKLREVTRPAPRNPSKITYDPGWTDQAVADLFSIQRKSVTYIRQSAVGALVRKVDVPKAPADDTEIEAVIRGAVAALVKPLEIRVSNLSASTIESLNKLVAAQELINRRINTVHDIISTFEARAIAMEDLVRLQANHGHTLLARLNALEDAREQAPRSVVEVIKQAPDKSTLMADKLREAAQRIEKSPA